MRAEKQVLRWLRLSEWITPEGRVLAENAYRTQAALTLQRAIRQYRKSKGKSVSQFRRDTMALSGSMLRVMREPIDDYYKLHVEKIVANRFAELDFNDPQFVRNIYKSLRLGNIDLNQMHMALQLYDVKRWLYDTDGRDYRFKRYEYNDPVGPYQVQSEIKYSTPDQVQAFYRSLDKVEDQTYFTINFSAFQEYCFFMDGIGRFLESENSFFKELLSRYLSKYFISEEVDDYFHALETEKKPNRRRNIIDIALQRAGINYSEKYKNRINTSTKFLCAIVAAGEEAPGLVLSPDYDEKNLSSPVVAFILTSLVAEEKLQLAVHGKEAVASAPVAGTSDIRFFRASYERPEKDSVLGALYGHHYGHYKRSVRPLELVSPDLKKTENPHTFLADDFMLTWHDRYHAWRSSSNFKALIRHEMALLSRRGICHKNDFVMTQGILMLSDMDFPDGTIIRKASFIEEKYVAIADFVSAVLGEVGAITLNSDLFLLNFVDMVRRDVIWNGLIQALLSDENMTLRDLMVEKADVNTHLKVAYEDRLLMSTILQSGPEKSTESLILRCKLRLIAGAGVLCDLADDIGLSNLLYWGANSGLHVKPTFQIEMKKYLGSEKIALDDLRTPLELVVVLLVFILKSGNDAQTRQLIDNITNWINPLLDGGHFSLAEDICYEHQLSHPRINQILLLRHDRIFDLALPFDHDACLVFLKQGNPDAAFLLKIMRDPAISDAVIQAVLSHREWTDQESNVILSDATVSPAILLEIVRLSSSHDVIKSVAEHPCCDDTVALAILRNKKVMLARLDLQKLIRGFIEKNKEIRLTQEYHPYMVKERASHLTILQIARGSCDNDMLLHILKDRNDIFDDIQLAVIRNQYASYNTLLYLLKLKINSDKVLLALFDRVKEGDRALFECAFYQSKTITASVLRAVALALNQLSPEALVTRFSHHATFFIQSISRHPQCDGIVQRALLSGPHASGVLCQMIMSNAKSGKVRFFVNRRMEVDFQAQSSFSKRQV